jgi:Xaa-Pro aminopeptidase
MSLTRINRLTQLAAQARFDCVAITPGPNMHYFTGLSYHLSERPITVFFPIKGKPAIVVPAFEASKTEHSPIEWQVFTYKDGQEPSEAYEAAAKALGMDSWRIGVEALTMRVMELRLLEASALKAKFDPAEEIIAPMRMIKDADEVAAMRKAVAITENALAHVLGVIKPGMTERQVSAELTMALLRGGAESLSFEPLIQSGPNSALPHYIVGDRVIRRGDILLLDFGVTVDGYASDITRTYVIGEASAEIQKIYDLVKRSNEAGRVAGKPGASGQDVERAARQVIEDGGYGKYFTHRTGHGLGLEGHEPPYMVEGNAVPLEVGNTYTVEPGIYIPGLGGVRIEDDMLITPNGSESLTTFKRELMLIK